MSGNCHSRELYLLLIDSIFFQGDLAGVMAKLHKAVQDPPTVGSNSGSVFVKFEILEKSCMRLCS